MAHTNGEQQLEGMVIVRGEGHGFAQTIIAGEHRYLSDEPPSPFPELVTEPSQTAGEDNEGSDGNVDPPPCRRVQLEDIVAGGHEELVSDERYEAGGRLEGADHDHDHGAELGDSRRPCLTFGLVRRCRLFGHSWSSCSQ